MRIKHYSIFNGDQKTLNWDNLRNDSSEHPYFLPFSRKEYINKVDCEFPSENVQSLILVCKELGIESIFSIGSGIGAFEYQIKKFSDIKVSVSDYSSSIDRLSEFGIFDKVVQLDAFKDALPVDDRTLVLLPRIDTEFDDGQLKLIFQKCYDNSVPYLWFIPAELLTFRILLAEFKVLLMCVLKNKTRVFCGYARSLDSFENLWGEFYDRIKNYNRDNKSFLLKLKKRL